jgi:hypothetical protein
MNEPEVVACARGEELDMCYCDLGSLPTIEEINQNTVPDDALVCTPCWRRICSIRGLSFGAIDPEAWRELCTKRGYLFSRENPRGF